VPLTPDDAPYTGPCFSLSDDRGPTKSPTVTALKIAMRRLNVAVIPDLTDYYSLELENAMRLFQQKAGISPATGQFGRGSYEALLKAFTAKGNHAFDDRAIALIKSDVKAVVPAG
jgi:peptidoglycan hydrolase-like protein with peptidoglycan-binding domain